MARYGVLIDKCAQHGGAPDEVIPRLVEETGSLSSAAIRLGLNRNTLAVWLNTHGYMLRTWQCARLEKMEQGA